MVVPAGPRLVPVRRNRRWAGRTSERRRGGPRGPQSGPQSGPRWSPPFWFGGTAVELGERASAAGVVPVVPKVVPDW